MATSNALVYYHELVKAGIPDEQAFNQAMAFDNAIGHLVTKDEMNARFDNLEIRLDARFDKIDARFDKMDLNYRWLMGIGITIIGAIVTMIFKI